MFIRLYSDTKDDKMKKMEWSLPRRKKKNIYMIYINQTEMDHNLLFFRTQYKKKLANVH